MAAAAAEHVPVVDMRTSVEATANPLVGILELNILEAIGVPPMDLNGHADPYVVVTFGAKSMKTSIKKFTLSPKWNDRFRILVHKDEAAYDLEFTLWDWDYASKDDRIGSCTLPLTVITAKGPAQEAHPFELTYDVSDISKRKKLMSKLVRAKKTHVLKISAVFITKEEMQRQFWEGIVDYFDSDLNGSIDHLEFIGLLEGMGSDVTDEQVDEMFAALDANNDGSITAGELNSFMCNPQNEMAAHIWPGHNELIWQVSLAVQEGQTIGDIVMNDWKMRPVDELASKMKDDKAKAKEILVHVRETGKLEIEKIPNYIKVSLKLMYSTNVGRLATSGKQVKGLLRRMTINQGKTYTNPSSVKAIKPFIAFHNLNLDEIRDDLDSFQNFNEFFYRKLKPSARPIAAPDEDDVAVSPADCRLNVFPSIDIATDIWIKGSKFNLESLFSSPELAAKYETGSLVIARLAPQDYHRFHSPVKGKLTSYNVIDGAYYTVNPIAINKSIDVYCQNKRLVTEIDTKEFGDVCFVAVGATMVGSICMTAEEGSHVHKGDELGYFAFGGSTTLVFFQHNRINFDDDLVVNSLKPIETLVKVGNSLGRAQVQ